ncbi:PqqD family protein [Desulfopila sp. IMCC35008]|uniref:PqqD family protein n=1 Tax=Desulfopila sp. IMCC35008 TaxID=2653858 RepID=UPI0013D72B4B|nr:PqqD family protein [Desulfopila sp. IMCC35008]
MKLFRNKRPAYQISREEALNCIPEIIPSVHWQHLENGDVLIEYQLAIKPMLQAIFKRFNQGKNEEIKKKLQLDSHGSRVFSFINGEKTVREIIEEFARATTITRQEAELSVTTFLRELGKRGIIILR